jgi:hypothetical protein
MRAQEKVKEWVELALVVSVLGVSALAVSALAVSEWGAKEAASEKASETESAPANHKRTQVQPCRMRRSKMPNHGPMALHRSRAELGNH